LNWAKGEWEEKDGGPLVGVAKGGGGCVQGGCLDPAVNGLHGGGALDLDAEMTRRKKPRTGSTTDTSMMNPNVLGLWSKTNRHKKEDDIRKQEANRRTDLMLERHNDKPTSAGKLAHTPTTGLESQPMTAWPKEQDRDKGKKQR
jgi:hypothetical protein